jgi:thioredoxin reductase (NADPH)
VTDTLYDTLIVGGGPAGLAAALHLGWHRRRALVIDRVSGPLFFTLEQLWNVPGMPGATGVEIQKRLKGQAMEMGAEVQHGNVLKAEGQEGDFLLTGAKGAKGQSWRGRTLLLATGVARYHPTVDGDFTPCFAHAGKGNLFYCADCEGPELFGRDTIVIGTGAADRAAATAVGLSRYTEKLRLLLTGDSAPSEPWAARLDERHIPVLTGEIHQLIEGEKRHLAGLELQDGSRLAAEAFFVSSPAHGRTDLALQLGVEMAADGEHASPRSQRGDTNVPGVWIAGDLRPISQQVAIALGTGNLAALMIDQHLRKADVAGAVSEKPAAV